MALPPVDQAPLSELIPQFPADLPVPIVIVQHMPPLFTRLFSERLNTLAQLRVREGKAGQKLHPGQVWIAPGDQHMTVARKGTDFLLASTVMLRKIPADPQWMCCYARWLKPTVRMCRR